MKGKKGFNAKEFLVTHAEKLGFGLIALMVVGVWAAEFFGGSWSRERRNPDALIQQIDQKRKEIDGPGNLWPADKQAAFKPVDFSERATTLLRPIDGSKYELSTELFFPLNRPKEKAREPEYLAVESLTAVQGHVVLALMSDEDKKMNESGSESDPMANPDADMEEEEGDEFTPRTNNSGAAGGIGGRLGLGAADGAPPGRPGEGKFDKKALKIGPGALPSGGAALVGQEESEKSSRGKHKRRGLSGQSPAGRFYVAVRGVWPVNRQLERIQRALHLPTKSAALEHLELMDFDLERQVATQGEDPWSKPWVKLDLSRATEILKEVDGFDDEPAEMEVFDPVITMPLPMRAFGVWTDAATHPRIKNFLLTPEGKEREKILMQRIKEESERMKLDLDKGKKPKGGFAEQVNDFRKMGNAINQQNPKRMTGMMKEMATGFQTTMPHRGMDVSPEKLSAKITAVGQLLLFRYFDFDVRPGYAYRYRVKLWLNNPNYERAVNEVTDPSVAEGEYRDTPFSNVSNAAVLPVSPKYFLHRIDRIPLVEDSRRSRSVASVNMFEWHKELGTQVSSMLDLTSLGQFVGGEKEVKVLDVTVPEEDDQVYPFSSEDVVLDGQADAELSPDLHPDLQLEANKNNKPVELGLAAELMVVNSGGELRVLEAGQDAAEERALRSRLKSERKAVEGLLKKKEDGAANPLDGAPAGLGFGAEGAKSGGKGGAKNAKGSSPPGRGSDATANPRRKSGKGGATAAAGAMPSKMGGARGGYSSPPGGGGGRRDR